MATILTKRSNTASSVPVAGDLTNSTGGAELAVNTADKRLFTKDSGGTVVELGTNPSSVTLPNGTANGVPYLNGSKVLTSGSALTFDGTNLGIGTSSPTATGNYRVTEIKSANATSGGMLILGTSDNSGIARLYNTSTQILLDDSNSTSDIYIKTNAANNVLIGTNNTERLRIDSSGNVGIGTSSPAVGLNVQTNTNTISSGNYPYNLLVTDNREYNATAPIAGGGIGFGFKYTAAGAIATGSTIQGYKENITDGDYGGGIRFFTRANGSNPAERMRLDSAGNLGLGVTPSAWRSVYKALQTNGGSFYGFTSNDRLGMVQNGYVDATSTSWTYVTTAAASRYDQIGGVHAWYTAPSGTAGNAISFTQAMTLDASGNLVVGGSSASARLHGISSSAGGTTYALMTDNAAGGAGVNIAGLAFANSGSMKSSITAAVYGNDYMAFNVGGSGTTERARIDSSGNFDLQNPSVANKGLNLVYDNGGGVSYLYVNHLNVTSGNWYAGFGYNGSAIGSIAQNGTTGVAYNTSSDYRLKNSIAPMTGALAKVAALKPCTYKWNADGSDGEGFIAHELAEVVPQCVTGEKDAVDADGNPVYQGIDTSFLVATLTAAIQELKAEVDSLKAEINTLKGI